MEFLKLFLKAIALLPTLMQGIETLYGAKTGAQKRRRRSTSSVRRSTWLMRWRRSRLSIGAVYGGAGRDCGWRGGVSERKHLEQGLAPGSRIIWP